MSLKRYISPILNILVALICFNQSSLFAQYDSLNFWQLETQEEFPDYRAAVRSFEKFWEGKPYKHGAGITTFNRWRNWYETYADKNGITLREQIKAFNQYRNAHLDKRKNFQASWKSLGPNLTPRKADGIGRINVIGFPPNTTDQIWVGTPSGGLWMSSDNGKTWLTTTDTIPYLGVSDIAFHPTKNGTAYISTGDRDGTGPIAIGVWKTVDSGISWEKIGLENVYRIHRLLIFPDQPTHLIAATNSGIYKSTDGGGQWNRIELGNFHFMEFKPGDPSTIYATTFRDSKMYKSSDRGSTFEEIPLPKVEKTPQRIAIGITASNPSVVYLLAGYTSNNNNDFSALFLSQNSGNSFEVVSVEDEPILGSQLSYDWAFVISPEAENVMFAGGVGLGKTIDRGNNWTRSRNGIHVDFHHLIFHPVNNNLYVANDGGIFASSDFGNSWTDLSDGLEITQYYRLGTSNVNPNLIFAGCQDNGSHRHDAENWEKIGARDGAESAADFWNEDIAYIQNNIGQIRRTEDGGENFSTIFSESISGEDALLTSPYAISPHNPNLIIAAHKTIWRSSNAGQTWTNPNSDIINFRIQHIAFSPSDTNIIYASDCASIYRSENSGLSWDTINVSGIPRGCISNLAVHPYNPDRLAILNRRKVYETTDLGKNWQDISNGLPDIVLHSIAFQNGTDGDLYIGADVGVYYKGATMSEWVPYYNGLPNVRVSEIEIDPCFNKIRAATFGRSIWESELYRRSDSSICCANLKIPIISDFNECGNEAVLLRTPTLSYPHGYQLNWYKDDIPLNWNADTFLASKSGIYGVQLQAAFDEACNSRISETNIKIDSCGYRACSPLNPNTILGAGNYTKIGIPTSAFIRDRMVENTRLIVSISADIETPDNRFQILDEDQHILGLSSNQYQCDGYSQDIFEITKSQLEDWMKDDTIFVFLDPISTHIDPNKCSTNEVCGELHLTYSSTTSVKDSPGDKTQIPKIKINPNPAYDYTIIKFENQSHRNNKLQIDLFDINGKNVLSAKDIFLNPEHQLDVSCLTAGVYILKISDKGNSILSSQILLRSHN